MDTKDSDIELATAHAPSHTGSNDLSSPPIKLNNGAQVEVIDLSYGLAGGKKQLLHNINLIIKPGDMVALMGPSGAGKSTLLDLIANRKIYGELSGQILINRKQWTKDFNRETAYCLQDDMHFPILTVEETIQYAAWTRMPRGTTAEAMEERVNLLLKMMGLGHVRKTLVGGPHVKGISGGQMKRLSIAVEIIALPYMIFLDEPTSGLDSAIALEVMQSVRTLADGGTTIVATIHQPSNEAFALFNKVAFLAAGKIVYFGPTSELVTYFSNPELGFKLPTHIVDAARGLIREDSGDEMPIEHNQQPGSKYFNVADFVLEVCSQKVLSETAAGSNHLSASELAHFYLQSAVYQQVKRDMEVAHESVVSSSITDNDTTNKESTFVTQFCMCLHRAVMTTVKDTDLLKYLVFSNLAMGILIGIVFVGQAGPPSEPLFPGGFVSTQAINFTTMLGCLFFYPYILSQAIMHSLVHKIIQYEREMKAGAFGVLAVWSAEIIMPLGFIFLLNWLYFIPAYFLIQLPNTASSFFFLFFMVYLVRLITYYLLVWFIAWSKDENIALLGYYAIALFLEYVFNGITILASALPTFWIFAPYISYLRYAMQGAMQFYFSSYPTDDNSEYTSGNGNILAYYSFNLVPQNFNFLVLVAFMVGHSFAALYFMHLPSSKLKQVTFGDHNSADVPHEPTAIPSTTRESYSSPPEQAEHTQVRAAVQSTSSERAVLASRPSLLVTISERLTNVQTPTLRNTSVKRTGLQAFRSNSISVRLPRVNSEEIEEIEEVEETTGEEEPALTVDYFRQRSSLVEPAKGCILAFRDVNYYADSKVHILKGVSGVVKPGEMCAMLGASGAGKSTLLDVLAARKTTGVVTGDIVYNGKQRSPEILKTSAYIMQDNIHFAKLTVEETVYFSAELRLSETMPRAEKDARVKQIIDMLGLTKVSGTLVGNSSIRGISGGQLKRLSIAVEIVSLPDIIFLDEPTTGLDGTTALEVMSAIRNLADQHRTVLFTIHSPSVEMGKLFDNLILMQSGKIAYFGPCSDATSFFTSSPFELPVKFSIDKNPYEDLISIVGTPELKQKQNATKTVGTSESQEECLSLSDYYSRSILFKSIVAQLENELKLLDRVQVSTSNQDAEFADGQPHSDMVYVRRQKDLSGSGLVAQRSYLTSTTHQVKTLLHRSYVLWTQNLVTLAGYYMVPIGFAIFYGWVFFQTGSPAQFSEADTTYNMIFLLWVAPNTYYYLQQMWVADAIDSRLVFYRERGASACGIIAFWMSCWVIPTFYTMTSVVPYCGILFYMTSMAGNTEGYIFGWFLLINLLVGLLSLYAMLSFAAVSPTVEVAHTILPLWLCFSDSFAGLTLVISSFPDWLYYWAPFIDFSRWSYQGVMLNEFLGNPTFASSGQGTIDSFGFNTYDKQTCAWVLVGFTLGYLALMLVCTVWFDYEKR